MTNSIAQVNNRFAAYLSVGVSEEIFEHDGMFDRSRAHPMEHYMSVGRSAIDVIARAMIASGKTKIGTVLDLPSGAGRVTRHLKAFFPDSDIFVSELDTRLETFAATVLGAIPFKAARDFSEPPNRTFDLIFVGSLVTHFDQGLFRKALGWFIEALAPSGLLVLTTHGRQHDLRQRNIRQFIAAEDWENAYASFVGTGFGYVPYPDQVNYGLSICRPSWLLGLVESNPALRIVYFQEGVWNGHHDILSVQRQALDGGPPIAIPAA
jgi:SAM-dependent methyltransferase